MVEQGLDDAPGNPSRTHGTLRRTALILFGGAAGILVGFVLLTALARPASAAPLPSGIIPSATTVPGSPDNSVSSSLPAVPAVTGAVAAVTAPATPTVVPAISPAVVPPAIPLPLSSIPTVAPGLSSGLQTLSGAVSSTASTLATTPVLGSVPSATVPSVGSAQNPALNGSAVATSPVGRAGHSVPSSGTAGFTVNGSGPGNSPSAPVTPPTSPTPLPAPTAPLQNTPLTANDATGSSAGQGGGLFSSAPLASLLPPMSSIGGVRPVREKVPQLLLASRCTPPG
jgi:hypothetical protein